MMACPICCIKRSVVLNTRVQFCLICTVTAVQTTKTFTKNSENTEQNFTGQLLPRRRNVWPVPWNDSS